MKTVVIGSIVGLLGLAIATIAILGIYSVNVYNTQVSLKNLYDSKVSANKAELSNLKSKFSEVASVSTAQMEMLEKLFTNYAASRTPEASRAIMSWVQESVPNVDQTTFLNLQNIVASSRDSWTSRQTELVDISRVFNTNLDTVPRGFILRLFGKFEKIVPIVVITSDTQRAFETGIDEPANLFRKP